MYIFSLSARHERVVVCPCRSIRAVMMQWVAGAAVGLQLTGHGVRGDFPCQRR